jgi:hypothetical protein
VEAAPPPGGVGEPMIVTQWSAQMPQSRLRTALLAQPQGCPFQLEYFPISFEFQTCESRASKESLELTKTRNNQTVDESNANLKNMRW